MVTFGGDGTILHAGSLFSLAESVPPILSFSLGTLGFLSEWKYKEYKKAWRQVYMSGSGVHGRNLEPGTGEQQRLRNKGGSGDGWDASLGASQGPARTARVLLRDRLRVHFPSSVNGCDITSPTALGSMSEDNGTESHAMNELLLHRGSSPHLTHLTILLNGRPLTTAIADGLLISTPTGSTAYSLSSGGSIVHPLVKGIVVNTVCARSLSFRYADSTNPRTLRVLTRCSALRPLVLPANASIGVKVASPTRGKVDVSIDGKKVHSLSVGEEVHVRGEGFMAGSSAAEDGRPSRPSEKLVRGVNEVLTGGVPCIVHTREAHETPRLSHGAGDEGWVDGLNGLLKFNYPFGDEG